MPWTLAHPAAILPVRWLCKKLPMPALVIGSLTPDAGYYVNAFAFADQAHSFWGLFSHCLPVGLTLLALISLLRQPLLFLLPSKHRIALMREYAQPLSLNYAYLFFSVIAIVLGAATHVFWDHFTHAGSDALPNEMLFNLQGRNIYWYNLLQIASSVLGTLALIIYYIYWLKKQPRRQTWQLDGWEQYRFVWLTLLCCAAFFYGYLTTDYFQPKQTPFYLIYFKWILASSSFFVVSYVLSAVIAYSVWRFTEGKTAE